MATTPAATLHLDRKRRLSLIPMFANAWKGEATYQAELYSLHRKKHCQLSLSTSRCRFISTAKRFGLCIILADTRMATASFILRLQTSFIWGMISLPENFRSLIWQAV